ncbi:hypothetical protein G9A89_003568 [Geosiphon pyriformis]|nr:hypothetical protein G9A89_003568 [Geosiphon pyriformis]
MAPQKLLHALLRDFGTLLNNEIFSDVRIIVGDGLNTKTFHGHSPILAARSSYFAVALSSNWVKRENNTIIFSKPNISPQMFEVILRYIYSGEILLDEYEVPIIVELLVAADILCFDVRIIVGDGSNTKTFHSHSPILARSSYFAVALSSNWAKRENNTIIFSKPNISPQIFEVIIRYIYSGEILLDEYEVPIVVELLVAADELIMEDLISHLEDYLIKQHEEELKENFFTLRETSNRHESFKNALASILCRDDLNLEEFQIWEKIIEWGVAKSGSNIKAEEILNWTIEELLPLIRFFHILSFTSLYSSGSHHKSVDAQPFRPIDSKLLELHNMRLA